MRATQNPDKAMKHKEMRKAVESLLKNGIYRGKKYTAEDINAKFTFELAVERDGHVCLNKRVNKMKLLADFALLDKFSIVDTGYFCILNEHRNGSGYLN